MAACYSFLSRPIGENDLWRRLARGREIRRRIFGRVDEELKEQS